MFRYLHDFRFEPTTKAIVSHSFTLDCAFLFCSSIFAGHSSRLFSSFVSFHLLVSSCVARIHLCKLKPATADPADWAMSNGFSKKKTKTKNKTIDGAFFCLFLFFYLFFRFQSQPTNSNVVRTWLNALDFVAKRIAIVVIVTISDCFGDELHWFFDNLLPQNTRSRYSRYFK